MLYPLVFTEKESLLTVEGVSGEARIDHQRRKVYVRGSLSAVRRRIVLDDVRARLRLFRARSGLVPLIRETLD